MSSLDYYNWKIRETKKSSLTSRIAPAMYVSSFNNETKNWDYINQDELKKRQLITFKEIESAVLSGDWTNMSDAHPDLKFVRLLKKYCKVLKDNQAAANDRIALYLIANNKAEIDWRTEYDVFKLIRSSWTEGEISTEHTSNIFRLMANKLFQAVFFRTSKKNVNFPEPEPISSDSPYQPWKNPNSGISSVGKRKCRVCGRPAFDDVCYAHIK